VNKILNENRKVKTIFLGTSSGTPTKTRNVSAYAVSEEQSKDWYLIDCGEGTQHRILHAPVSLLNLKAILITHVHGDHCYGLPGLVASAGMLGRTKPLTIVAPKGIQELMQAVMINTDLHIGYEITYVLPVDGMDVFHGASISVSAIQLSHRVESYGYKFIETNIESTLDTIKLVELGIEQGPIWGKLKNGETVQLENGNKICGADFLSVTRKPRSIVVCGDNDNPELLAQACVEVDVLIHESTYTEEVLLQVGPTVQHCSAERLAKFAESVEVKNLVLTHFSARYSDNENAKVSIDLISDEAKQYYSGNLVTAGDLNVYELNRCGKYIRLN
jgi:ribonuclease Z